MDASNFSEHWDQAQFCYFRAEATKNPVIKHLWIQLAQDWIALSDNAVPDVDQLNYAHFEPELVA
jgi:hypothetical protein